MYSLAPLANKRRNSWPVFLPIVNPGAELDQNIGGWDVFSDTTIWHSNVIRQGITPDPVYGGFRFFYAEKPAGTGGGGLYSLSQRQILIPTRLISLIDAGKITATIKGFQYNSTAQSSGYFTFNFRGANSNVTLPNNFSRTPTANVGAKWTEIVGTPFLVPVGARYASIDVYAGWNNDNGIVAFDNIRLEFNPVVP